MSSPIRLLTGKPSLKDSLQVVLLPAGSNPPDPFKNALAGTKVGAAYLSFFVGKDAPKQMPTTPWVHLDIAGTAVSEGDSDWEGLYPKGPTGWGVRTLVRLIAELK
jgi:hypothetical protein